MNTFAFTAELWRHTGQAAWYFVTLPHDIADEIDEMAGDACSRCARGSRG